MGYRYIGSKARIADDIIKYLGNPSNNEGYFIDAFSGTGIVASKAADNGWKIKINDMMLNAVVMSESQLLSGDDVSFEKLGGYDQVFSLLNNSEGKKGFIWKEYSPASKELIGIERRYFTENNALKIDGITSQIFEWLHNDLISHKEFVFLMASLISATNNVANIAGTYGCFLSKWTEQSKKSLCLTPIYFRETTVDYIATNYDVFSVESSESDVVYLDPPYTKRQYASYYHILETIVSGDEPTVVGTAGLRPWENKSSVFCYKTKALKALVRLVVQQKANRVLISYSNDGHVQLESFRDELAKYGDVKIIELASIGRYRPNATASSGKQEVKEYLINFQKHRGEINESPANI